jgi:hypothetical protein
MEDPFKKMSIENQLRAVELVELLPNIASMITGRDLLPLRQSNVAAILRIKKILTPAQAQRFAAQIRPKVPELAELLYPAS